MIRVTEVLNYFKEPWYIDWVHRVGRTEANKIGKKAMAIGTRVDEIIKLRKQLQSDFLEVFKKEKEEVLNCLSAYRKWYEVYQPKSITPCTRLNATIEGHEVTGEPDLMVDDVLVDIKCSSKISPSYWLQVNMYRNLLANTGVDGVLYNPGKVGILRLDKVSGSFEYVIQDYDPDKVSVWCGMLRAYVYFNKEKDNGDEL